MAGSQGRGKEKLTDKAPVAPPASVHFSLLHGQEKGVLPFAAKLNLNTKGDVSVAKRTMKTMDGNAAAAVSDSRVFVSDGFCFFGLQAGDKLEFHC